jgi:hypothetical protein
MPVTHTRNNPVSWRLRLRRATWLAAALAVLVVSREHARGQVSVEKSEYKGWANALRIANADAELIVTLDVGPRIISYRLKDGENVLKQYDDQLGKGGELTWQIRGGHRLWVAPEDIRRTYAPDNVPVSFARFSDGSVRVDTPPDAFGIQKSMEIRLSPEGSRVRILHRVRNAGPQPTTLAPWALTVMRPGGVEILPLAPHAPHPGSSADAKGPDDFLPNQAIILWSYFDFGDDRWTFGSKYVLMRHKQRGPTKLGLANDQGWAAYLNDGTLFVKRFASQKGLPYPDRGAVYETFSNEDMVEMESLGPLVTLAPDAAVEHVETWSLAGGVDQIRGEDDVDRVVLPHVGEDQPPAGRD